MTSDEQDDAIADMLRKREQAFADGALPQRLPEPFRDTVIPLGRKLPHRVPPNGHILGRPGESAPRPSLRPLAPGDARGLRDQPVLFDPSEAVTSLSQTVSDLQSTVAKLQRAIVVLMEEAKQAELRTSRKVGDLVKSVAGVRELQQERNLQHADLDERSARIVRAFRGMALSLAMADQELGPTTMCAAAGFNPSTTKTVETYRTETPVAKPAAPVIADTHLAPATMSLEPESFEDVCGCGNPMSMCPANPHADQSKTLPQSECSILPQRPISLGLMGVR